MIWCRGEIMPDDALSISVLDRTFEHGLGLFETLRTWSGRPGLLDAHRARMLASAQALGLNLDPSTLPDEHAVARLIEAEGSLGDRLLRITASGGVGSEPSSIWMSSGNLPAPITGSGAVISLAWEESTSRDRLRSHKSLNYWARRLAYETERAKGCDEALLAIKQGWVEGSRSNLFIVHNGEIQTPTIASAIVPGVMRSLILEIAGSSSFVVKQPESISQVALKTADEVFLTNAVRGIIPVAEARWEGLARDALRWDSPGKLTLKLQEMLARRLGMLEESP